jgi:hypothetical protein
MKRKPAHVVEVRPTRPDDGEFFAPCTWVATDSTGKRFGAGSEAASRQLCETYNAPAKPVKEKKP